jgi:hypothetical protein
VKRVYENADGWSDWQAPTMKRYRMACCDCGLVHNMQFKVVRVTSRKGSTFMGTKVGGHKVLFRAQRNKRSTTMMRKKQK